MRKATTVGKHAENGQRIFRARRRKGLTQTQLGALAGITYRQIIRLENGEHLPSGGVRDRLASALDIPMESILSGDDEEVADGDPFLSGSSSNVRANRGAGGRAGAGTAGEVAA